MRVSLAHKSGCGAESTTSLALHYHKLHLSVQFTAWNRVQQPQLITTWELLPPKNTGSEMNCNVEQMGPLPEAAPLSDTVPLMAALSLERWVELARLKAGDHFIILFCSSFRMEMLPSLPSTPSEPLIKTEMGPSTSESSSVHCPSPPEAALSRS